MGTSQNLPAAVRVVRRERGFVGDDLGRDMELCPEPISSVFPFLLIVSELGLQSAAAPKCSGAFMGMPQLWRQKIIFSGVIFYAVSGCVADV